MDLLILVFSVIGNLSLGLLVYLKNPNSATNKLFAALTGTLILLVIANYFSVVTQSFATAEEILFWIRLTMFFAAPTGLFYLLFVLAFPKQSVPLSKLKIAIFSVLTIITMVSALSPYLFTELNVLPNTVQPVPGPAIILFVISPISLIIVSVGILIKRLIATNFIEKKQINLILIGTSIMFGLIIGTVFIAVNVLNFTLFVPFTPAYTLIFVGATAYAIIKHRLLDIGLIVARAVAYALLATILFAFYIFSTIIGTSILFDSPAQLEQLILYSILTLIAAYSFVPLKNLLEKFTDKIFYRVGYDSPELLSDLTKIMATTLGLTSLMERLLVKVLPEMRISKGAFVLLEKGKLDGHKAIGFGKKVDFVGSDIDALLETGKILLLDEITKPKIKKIMQDLDITVSVPLKVGNDQLGIMLLGHKLSGEIYSEQDIKVLEILSPEISIAIQNAKAYEEIRKFNITLQKEIEKATSDLRSANAKLKDLDKLKDEFMSIASHELRTPMTAIKSYVWLSLHGKTQEKDPKVRDYLNKVYDSSERMITMINDMLNVSRIETGRIQMEIVPVAIYKIADLVSEELSARAKETGVKIIINKESAVPNVLADRDKLIEILTNLIGNSLKFTKKGGSITVKAEKKGSLVETSVTDTGVGISKENLTKLFKKYGKISDSYATVSPTTGTGLGLYITKQYLEKMNGYINVDSTLGKGTTFTFALPLATGKELAQPDDDQERPVGIVFNPEFLKKSKAARKIESQQKPS